MKHKRIGFTLIEVALFLAVTGLLFMGIIIGTGNSVANQRFFDTTQNFAEFLRSIYSQVSNPQSIGDGRGELAIFGKMISFGQKKDLGGDNILNASGMPIDGQRVYVYDVVGNVVGTGTGTAVEMLKSVSANVVVLKNASGDIIGAGDTTTQIKSASFAGIVDSYEPRWGASVENIAQKTVSNNNNLYKGTILIVRHPISGTINTLVYDNTINVNEAYASARESGNYNSLRSLLSSKLNSFRAVEVNFCINPEGAFVKSDNRWNVRLMENARNASGVEVIELDDLSSTDGDGTLNKCRA